MLRIILSTSQPPIAGIIWRLAYADRLVFWLGTMPVFAGSVELLQVFVPGRHARLSDFAVDALGGCIGILIILGNGSLSGIG